MKGNSGTSKLNRIPYQLFSTTNLMIRPGRIQANEEWKDCREDIQST